MSESSQRWASQIERTIRDISGRGTILRERSYNGRDSMTAMLSATNVYEAEVMSCH